MKAALKRGVEHGILRRYRGHYFLPTGDELDRANRIALRFARLPTPALLLVKSKTNCALQLKNRKGPRGIGNRGRKSKKVEKSRTLSVSASSSLTDKIVGDAVSVTEWNYLAKSLYSPRKRFYLVTCHLSVSCSLCVLVMCARSRVWLSLIFH